MWRAAASLQHKARPDAIAMARRLAVDASYQQADDFVGAASKNVTFLFTDNITVPKVQTLFLIILNQSFDI